MSQIESSELSIVIPAKNEGSSLRTLIPGIQSLYSDAEIIVVNDGSNDDTAAVCEQCGINVVTHANSRGNGAAVKSGLRAASRRYVVLMDGDGQHSPEHIDSLLTGLAEGYDMVVGARSHAGQANLARSGANAFYNWFASTVSGTRIDDLTSGFRAARTARLKEFLYLFPNGFSYPTTSTMAFLRAGYGVAYVSVPVAKRVGKSHISPLKDGARFFAIILKIATLYSPLKLFLPISALLFAGGALYLWYTIETMGRFTNMSVLLFVTSLVAFLVGLVSEQITVLLYKEQAPRGD